MSEKITVSAREFLQEFASSDKFVRGELGAYSIHRALKKKLIASLMPLVNESARLNVEQKEHVRLHLNRHSMKGMFLGFVLFREERTLMLATYINSCHA